MGSRNVGDRINLKLFSLHVNLLMKIMNGSGKNCYRLASWNCHKDLICSNKQPTTKMTEKKVFVRNELIMCI